MAKKLPMHSARIEEDRSALLRSLSMSMPSLGLPSLRRLGGAVLLMVSLAACNTSPSESSSPDGSSGSGGRTAGGGGTSSGGVASGGAATGGSGTGAAGSGGGQAVVRCGYKNQGKVLVVSSDIELCLPPVVCNPETCPPGLGECQNGECVFQGDYKGLETLPEAWATQYCELGVNCDGVSQFRPVSTTATEIADAHGYPLCKNASADQVCVGIVAPPPMMVGNSEVAVDSGTQSPLPLWGLGLTEASGLCYELSGPGGSALVAVTDRCAGYCKCDGKSDYEECGFCVNASDLTPKCPCVGSVPPLYSECCARGAPILCSEPPAGDNQKAYCDWCASQNHPHFDLDDDTFRHLCGAEAEKGSCKLSKARYVPCAEPNPEWPINR